MNRSDARRFSCLDVHDSVIERLDFCLRRAGGLRLCRDVGNQLCNLLRNRQAQAVERTVDGKPGRNVGAVQPRFVDRLIKIVLAVRAFEGVDARKERLQILAGHRRIGVQQSVRFACDDTGRKHARKLLAAPHGRVGKALHACRRAGMIADRRGQSSERAVQHHERLRAGERAAQVQIAVRITL